MVDVSCGCCFKQNTHAFLRLMKQMQFGLFHLVVIYFLWCCMHYYFLLHISTHTRGTPYSFGFTSLYYDIDLVIIHCANMHIYMLHSYSVRSGLEMLIIFNKLHHAVKTTIFIGGLCIWKLTEMCVRRRRKRVQTAIFKQFCYDNTA